MRLVDGLAEAQVLRVDLGDLGGGRVAAAACSRGGSQGGIREDAGGMETERHLKSGDSAGLRSMGLFIRGSLVPRLDATQINSADPKFFSLATRNRTIHPTERSTTKPIRLPGRQTCPWA